jgi:hypothetical protein
MYVSESKRPFSRLCSSKPNSWTTNKNESESESDSTNPTNGRRARTWTLQNVPNNHPKLRKATVMEVRERAAEKAGKHRGGVLVTRHRGGRIAASVARLRCDLKSARYFAYIYTHIYMHIHKYSDLGLNKLTSIP